jgi:hypothetical protein
MLAATLVAIGVWFEASTRDAFVGLLVASVLVGLVGLVWLIRFVAALVKTRGRMGGSWFRWLIVPALLLGAQVLDAPFEIRMALSRPAMDQAAAEIIAGGSTDRSWIGLWPVSLVEPTADGISFVIAASGFLDQVGMVYSPSGMPADSGDEVEYRDLGGGWWRYTDSWD